MRVHKRRATVRSMFHNPDDVRWFRPVEVRVDLWWLTVKPTMCVAVWTCRAGTRAADQPAELERRAYRYNALVTSEHPRIP